MEINSIRIGSLLLTLLIIGLLFSIKKASHIRENISSTFRNFHQGLEEKRPTNTAPTPRSPQEIRDSAPKIKESP